MIPVGVACSCLVVSYLCVYATGKGRCDKSRARTLTHTNTHRVHLPTLGLDGQVYVCMCMGRYSV